MNIAKQCNFWLIETTYATVKNQFKQKLASKLIMLINNASLPLNIFYKKIFICKINLD